MALPWRSFTESVTLMQLMTASKITTTDIGTLYNVAYREIVESHQWSARKSEALINTVDPYSDGTVSVSQGGTTVTGVGTTFTSAMTGRFIRIGGSEAIYQITFVNATSLTLEKAWPYTAVSGDDYEIFQYKYVVDGTNGAVGQVLLPSAEWTIQEKSLYWITMVDPARRTSGAIAQAFILHGIDTNNAQMIEFWPRYESARQVRIPYYTRVDDLSGSNKPIIAAPVIEALATAYCFSSLFAKFGAPEYSQERDHWEEVFKARLDAAMEDDFERHGTPRAVQDALTQIRDWDYVTRHDI